MAADWNGKPIDKNTPSEEADDTAVLTGEMLLQREADQRRKLDADLLSFLRSPDAQDEDKAFKALDDYTKNRWGVQADHGNCWTPDRQPYANARQYADAMVGVLNRGYSAIATPEYKAWMKAKESGDRNAMIQAAGIETQKMATKANANGGMSDFFDPGMGMPNAMEPKTDAEIDDELKDYGAKIEGQNFVDTYRAVGHDFNDNEKQMVHAALKGGDGLPAEYEADFAALVRTDVEKANRVLFCINRARRNESALWRDTVHSFTETAYKMWRGTVDFAEETAGAIAKDSVFQKLVSQSSDSTKYYWNDAERAEYKRLIDSNQRGATGGFDPKDVVNRQCADRLRREAMPRDAYIRERRERLMLEEALGHQPYEGYNYAKRAVIGAVSTIPYMAMTAVPYVGFCANAASYFEQTRDDILMAGGDMDEAVGTQLLLAAAWAGVEQLEFKGLFGKPMTGLQRKAAIAKIWKAAGKDKLAKIGQLAAAGSKELLATTLCESIEEGAQGGIEGAEKAWFRTHDLRKALEAGGKQAVGDFVESIGTMGILGIVGTGTKTIRANRDAANLESLTDYAAKRLQVMNTLKGTTVDPEADASAPKPDVAVMLSDIQNIWTDAPNAVAALDQIQEKYGLDDKTMRTVGDYLDLRANLLDTARRMDSDGQAELVANVAGGAFRVGNDTTYDPVDLLHLVNPDIKVEDAEVDDLARNPTQKPVSQETQELRDRLAAAQERIDNAKVGSERRAAEREYRRVNKKLKSAEANEEAPTYPKMRVRRVTVPVGQTGETRSFTITENSEGPDIHTAGYAVSVANEMKKALAAGSAADGAKITAEDFKQLPTEEKMTYAVTPEQYMAMTENERDAYCRAWMLKSGGTFSMIDDETGKEMFGTDAMVQIMRAFRNPHSRVGGNWSLAHEYGHAISAFARAVGIIKTDSKSVAVMRKLFGDPTTDKELWNEEAANDGFAEYLRGKYDFKRLTPEERRASRGFFRNMLDTLRGIFSLSGSELPDTPVERTEREQALDAAYEAMRTGDFAGLDAFAGIDFAEDKATRPDATAPSVAPAAPEAASTASAQETANATHAAPEEPVAAPKPAPEPTVAYNPVAPESAPLRAGTKRTIFTPGYEMNVEADVMWVPLASLVESTDDREVQMRDRSRVATDQQVLTKTRKGVFQPLALFPGSKSDDGAPIVGGGLRIISGHGRKRMLDQLVKEGRYGEYLAAINAEAQRQGLPTSPEDMENPVIVSRVTGGLDKREDLTKFAELSNRWGGLERSGAEHAESDARKVSDALLRLYAPDASGNLLAASNRPFMSAFLKEVGATGLTNADGTPTAEAALRVQRAMMTAIFGNDERTRSIVQNLLERNQELSLATLQNALLKSAGRLLAMKRRHGSFDVVADVREAAYQYIAWRSAQAANPRLTLADHLNNSDFFTAAVPPMQQALAKLLAEGRFGSTLDKYAELVAQQADDAQATFVGIAETRTPLQLLGLAERAVIAEDDTPVTPDPASAEAAAPVQTPPAERVEKEEASDPVEAAQETLAPPEPETFTPAPLKRGTATLPGPGATGISGYQVNAEGNPSTEKKNLPAGAYNLLRAPYDVSRPSARSAQDKAGRGLYIANPPPTGHADIFPHFQGNKTEMAARTSQAIRRIMPKAEREHYETVVDYFGGGGCWGLYHTLENFPNAKYLVINEWDAGRIEKIRLLQEIDGEVADRAKAIIDTFVEELREACEVAKDGGESGSGKTIASKLGPRIEKYDGEERGVLTAFYDCASTMLGNNFDETGKASFDLGMEKVYDNLREDGRKAKAAADEFKARGGTIRYRKGDAASFHDAPKGDKVVAVCDPPYYMTANYNSDGSNAGIVPLDGDGWSYNATRNLIRALVDAGDALVYTDEAWWHKESYSPNPALGDDLFGNKSDFDREQEILLDITNTLDHFDVAGRVVGRQEVLGIHHGHDTKSEIGARNPDNGTDDARNGTDGRGDSDAQRASVRRMAGGAEEEGRADVVSGSSRGREGRIALAREVIVQDISDAIVKASGETAYMPSVNRIVRASVRQVREDRVAAYAATVSKNAKRWLAKEQKDLDAHMAAHGFTEKVWHGTDGEDFNAFEPSTASHGVPATYLTYRRETAQNYAALRSICVGDLDNAKPNVRQFYVNPGRVLDIDENQPGQATNFEEFKALVKKAYDDGYDSIRVKNAYNDQGFRFDGDETMENMTYPTEEHDVKTDILIVFDSRGNPGANRIKAADPVTFMDDVDGTLPIPMEMRADQSVPDVRFSVTMGKRFKEEARAMIAKYRPDSHGFVTNIDGTLTPLDVAAVNDLETYDTTKERKAALYWFCKSAVRLPEDHAKVVEAIKTAERAKVDPFQFERPGEILEKYAEYRPVDPPINPDTVPELSDRRDMGHGIVTYLVQDDQAGQAAMRKIINTHFGKKANPWCLLQGDGNGNLTDGAWSYWKHYNAFPKRVAFKDGKLVAFMASDKKNSVLSFTSHTDLKRIFPQYVDEWKAVSEPTGYSLTFREWLNKEHHDEFQKVFKDEEQWWDRADASHDGIPFTRSVPSPSGEGANATEHAELMPDGTTLVTKTTRGNEAKDGIYEEWYASGEYKLREMQNGQEVRFERYDENGVEREHMEKSFRDGLTVAISIEKNGEDNIRHLEVRDGWSGDSVYQSSRAFMMTETDDIARKINTTSDTYRIDEQTARELYYAFSIGDDATAKSIMADIKTRVVSSDERHSVSSRLAQIDKLFANSKVRNANGTLKDMYHGTYWIVDELPNGKATFKPGSHFGTYDAAVQRLTRDINDTEIPEDAEVYAVHLNVENPLVFDNDPFVYDSSSFVPCVKAKVDELGLEKNDAYERMMSERTEASAIAYLKSVGFDGIKYRNAIEDPNSESWVVFGPSQVKDISTWNRNPVEPNNADFRHSVRLKNYWKVLRGPFDAPQGAEVTSAGAYSAHNRELAWGLKLGRQKSIDEAARRMAPSIPDNAVIVPMPNHEGRAIRTMLLAYAISGEKDGVDIVDALEAEPHETSYHTKKLGKSPQITMRRRDVEIPPNRPVVIVDNVYASGATFAAAKKVLPEASLNVLVDAGRTQTKRETPEERHSVFIGIKGADKAKIAQGRLDKALKLLDEYESRHYASGDTDFDPSHDDAFRRDVYVKTGWWMGTDGLWRFEIGNIEPKPRFGKTVGDGSMVCNGIWFADKHDHSHGYCELTDICNSESLFEAYPELKNVSVKISNPDKMGDYVGMYNPNKTQIEISWDCVVWHNDEMSNVLNMDGYKTITHELQHAVQEIEDFSRGGNTKTHGETNYLRLAGEVEARNAEGRMFGVYDTLSSPRADEGDRSMLAKNYAPWATEDVPQSNQILVGSDGRMRDQRGNPVARHSVRSYSDGRRVSDLAAALVASRRLAGKDMAVEDVDKLVRNLGLSKIRTTAEIIEKANALADKNREKLRTMVERGDPALVETLAKQGYAESLAKQLDDLITGTAATADPGVGAKVQQAIQSKATRDLMNAHGFDAAQMMAELPVDLAQAIFAVAEYEKTPEELARLEAARKKREEERAAEEEMDEEEALEALDDPAYREPTDEERAKLDALLDRARFMEEARKAEEERKKADKKRKESETAEGSAAGDSSPGGSEADLLDGPTLPLDTVRRIAPVFESADLFASFLIEWTADHVAEKHPNIPNTAEMWKNPVAVRELKQTATHILRRLAKDVLGSPSLNYARNFADHAINELESDAECKTFNAVRRKIARIYDQIHDHALSLSRRQMVKKLAKTIRKKAIERGRFSAVKEDLKRKIDAKTEQWCRWLVPAITMSEEKLQDEINRLTALFTVDPADEHATPEDKLREAADHLAVLHKYGGMVRWMPGKIADAEAEIMEQLDGKRQAFEARREEHLEKDKAIRDALVAAVQQGASASYRKHTKLGDAVNRYTSAMMGNLTLEMQNLIRYCTDPALRTAALESIEEMQTWISEGSSRYRTILGQAQAELHEGLAQCYGNAEEGIRHLLRDEIPTEAANAIFTQGKDRVPTYGQLLQLYASTIQADYKDNAEQHGRTAALPLMEATMTDADRRFHAWSVEWFKRNRKALSDSVEAVTGLPVTSPDALYTPVRILREKTGFDAEGMGWSPVPSALNRRVVHDLDFNEGTNFLACLQEQAEVRAQTIGYAEIGIRLRDTIAHRDVQAAVRKDVGKADMKVVTDHVRDVLVQNAARKDESAFWAPLNVARKWMARFFLSGNVPSAVKQLASMPVWANAMIGGKTVGLTRCLHYITTVGTDEGKAALRELMASDGFKARYIMGWSEETQNLLMNPSRNRMMRYIERAYDKGMIVNKAVDGVSCLWMAQGFYRDATQSFIDKGFTPDEAKQKAMALTWSCLESGQQSGRVENMNTLQRRGGAGVAAMFQFKTAYLLQNNYLIQAMREIKAGTPGARGRFLRALFINTVWIPAFVATVNAAWSAIMGEPEPPEDEETWPTWLKAMCWSMIDGVTAPMFGLDSALHTLYDQMTDTRNWRQDSEIPALSGAIRVSRDAAKVVYDLGKYGIQSFDAFDFEEELTGEKLGKDVNRLIKDLLAPYRHGAKAIENRIKD